MEEYKYYFFGSEDSLDLDVVVVCPKLPDIVTCKEICFEYKKNFGFNANVIVIDNGVVTDCYKGSIDEMNNSLFNTFDFHKQKYYPNPIKSAVNRNIPMKLVKATRKILSTLSRTEYRSEVKKALSSNDFEQRIAVLSKIDFTILKIGSEKNQLNPEMLKIIAFQLSQTIALIKGTEFYTKGSLSKEYPDLKDFLYRNNIYNENLFILSKYREILISLISNIEFSKEQETLFNFKVTGFSENFLSQDICIDLKSEKNITI